MNEIERPPSRDLIGGAVLRGSISDVSHHALRDIGVLNAIERGLQGSQTATRPGRVTLVAMEIDDSGSMFETTYDEEGKRLNKAAAVVLGHNELLDEMRSGADGLRTLLLTRHLNGKVHNPFLPLSMCQKLDTSSFRAGGGTPLYEQTLITLGTVLAKTEELVARGATPRSATLILTDGEPTDWTLSREVQLAQVVRDMQQSGMHIIAGMGIGTPNQFRATFRKMGIPDGLIFSARDRKGILEAFRMFGKAMMELTSGPATPAAPSRGIIRL